MLISGEPSSGEADDALIEQVGEILLLIKEISLDISGALVEAGLEDVGSNRECQVLSILLREGPLRPKDLLSAAGMTSGGLTKLLDRLETLDLVRRDYGHVPGDHRGVSVALTPAGKAAVSAVDHVMARTLSGDEAKITRTLELLDQIAPVQAGQIDSESSPPAGYDVTRDLAELGEALLHALTTGVELDDPNPANATLALWSIGRREMTRPRHLTDATGLSSGGVSKLLDRLEADGLITRVAGRSTDRRAVVMDLTDRGREELTTRLLQMSNHLLWTNLTMRRVAAAVVIE